MTRCLLVCSSTVASVAVAELNQCQRKWIYNNSDCARGKLASVLETHVIATHFTLLFLFTLEEQRNTYINKYVYLRALRLSSSIFYFRPPPPQDEASRVPLTPKDRCEVSIKIRAMNHYGSRQLRGSNCVLAESLEVTAAWNLCTSC